MSNEDAAFSAAPHHTQGMAGFPYEEWCKWRDVLNELGTWERRLVWRELQRILVGQRAYGPWHPNKIPHLPTNRLEELLDDRIYRLFQEEEEGR